MRLGKNDYKLILLDTNALREIVTNANMCGKGFLEKFFMGYHLYAPCFSIYNAVELMPYQDIFNKFLDFFSFIPCLMFFPAKSIILEEYKYYQHNQPLQITNQIANAFSPVIDNDSYNCRKFFVKLIHNKELIRTIENEILGLSETALTWQRQRENAAQLLTQMGYPLNMIDEKYYKFNENETIEKDLKNWDIKSEKAIDISRFPSLRIMAYSQFNRVYLTKKEIKPNDVMDITINCVVPYVDAVITESFQANVLNKAKSFIPQIKSLEVYTLKDIRLKD